MRFLYTISIRSYHFAIRVASLFNRKAKLFTAGRKEVFEKLRSAAFRASQLPAGGQGATQVWFHCASLGEFEQGRPLIERYRKENPSHRILLTFFSPSGYEIRKNYEGADLVCYLPMDTPGNAKRFLDLVKPSAAFFVKYEFWFNYLSELKERNVPTYLVSGIFREDHHFFKSTGGWFRKQLQSFTYFFLQDDASLRRLNSIGYENAMVSGDTRFDRVSEIVSNVRQFDLVRKFAASGRILVLGSSWREDEILVSGFGFQAAGLKLIVAPHEIDETHLKKIEELFPGSLRYSKADDRTIEGSKVLVIDNIGMLSSLYQYGHIAFIGGGFGKGIHNILEAAAFGAPVIFGPNYHKFQEAEDLIRLGGAFEVTDISDLQRVMQLLSDEQVLRTASQVSKMYVQGKRGATEKILQRIRK